ncbi:MAG: preprotein translocase subunit SecE [Alphaproteobacteria bacterium]|nr:MAG: preprotein translocase subunit SecE [Alphaproteobacteria bacterium]
MNIKSFISGVQKEFNRISWPTVQETKITTIVVVILSFIMGLYFMLVDRIIIKMLTLILGV